MINLNIRRNNLQRISFVLIVLMLFYFLFFNNSFKEGLCKDAYNAFLESEFQGIIIKKYIDYRYNASPVLDIKDNDMIYSYSQSWDKSGFYDYVTINDSVFKNKFSNRIIVRSLGVDTIFIIKDYCDSLK